MSLDVILSEAQEPFILTTAPLAASGSYTTIGKAFANAAGYMPMNRWGEFDLFVGGAPFNAQGTLWFAFSMDGVNDHIGPIPNQINDLAVQLPIPLRNYPYVRVFYDNHGVNQTTFMIAMIRRTAVAGDLTRFPNQVIGPGEPLKVTRSLVEPSPLGARFLLGADRAVFGAAVIGSKITVVEADFSKALASNRVTLVGTTGQANGEATVTATAVPSTSSIESIKEIRYYPGSEGYALFTARFTAGIANSTQKAGVRNAGGDELSFGYNGVTFGIFYKRGAAAITFTALSAVNGDPLDSSFRSRFARNAVTEAINPLNKNVFRIRWGWLGSSVIHFEMQSPDGEWMRVHTLSFPNLQTMSSLLSPKLKMFVESAKTAGAAGTSMVIGTGSWQGGFVGDSYGLVPSNVFGRDHVDASVTVAGSAGIVNTLVHTVTTGRRLQVMTIELSLANTVAGGGEIEIRDNVTVKRRYQIEPAQGVNKTATHVFITYAEPIPFETSFRFVTPAIGVGVSASCNIVGYEESL